MKSSKYRKTETKTSIDAFSRENKNVSLRLMKTMMTQKAARETENAEQRPVFSHTVFH